MKYHLLKAKAKKKKFLQKKKKQEVLDDSDGSLSSDDEESYSEDIIGKLINEKYIIIKYLGKGTYSRVWCVLDIIDNRYLALKIQDDTYLDDIYNEINILKTLSKGVNLDNKDEIYENKFSLMYDNFDIKMNGKLYKCILFELLGESLEYLFYEENDDIISLELFKKVIYDILYGLNQIHKKGIVHTDLKLDNILIKQVNDELKKYLVEIEKLNISKYYNNLLTNSFPPEMKLLDKNKRKMIKKKIKKKVIKDVSKSFLSQIIEINKQFLYEEEESENLKLSITESDLNDNNNINIDINNFHIKIVDFGNSEYLNKTRNGSTYTRSYRPPENILNEYYNSKSDIWVIGCILYELFNRDLLFDLSNFQGSKIEKDRKHLSMMYSLLGKIPKEISMNSQFSEDLFDSKGRIIKNKEIEEINLKEKLNNRLELSDEDYNHLEDLLYKMLEYDVNKRLSAEELLKHNFFENMNF